MAIVFNDITKIIEIESPATEVTIQELINTVRDWEDELVNIDISQIASAAGKEDLGGGVSVGITMTLLNGWKVKFEDRAGPTYIPCRISGGNLVSSDGSIPYVGSAYVTIGLSASSAATSADSEAIQYSSYGGGVSIDVVNGITGTAYPIGTIETPVNNNIDAITIANIKGFSKIFVIGDLTITTGDDLTDMEIYGQSTYLSTITVDSTAIVNGCEFFDCTITGTLDENASISNSIIQNIDYFEGYIKNSILIGTIVLNGTIATHIIGCSDGIPGLTNATIDMGGSGRDLNLNDYSGGINIKNMNGANKVTLNVNAGNITIENTVTAGEVWCRGVGTLTDNSGVGATIYDNTLTQECIANSIWDEAIIDHVASGSFGEKINKKLLTLSKFLGLK